MRFAFERLVRVAAAAVILSSMVLGTGCFTAQRFVQGYRDGGGPAVHEAHLVEDVIPCESTWDPLADNGYGNLGLLQFDQGTWETVRRAPDSRWQDPYEQGFAAATHLNNGIDPGGSEGWPACWWSES